MDTISTATEEEMIAEFEIYKMIVLDAEARLLPSVDFAFQSPKYALVTSSSTASAAATTAMTAAISAAAAASSIFTHDADCYVADVAAVAVAAVAAVLAVAAVAVAAAAMMM